MSIADIPATGTPPRRSPLVEQVLDFGVEEEFVLADRDSRSSATKAGRVIKDAAGDLGPRVQREFYRSQVELNSEPGVSAEAMRADLLRSRRLAAAAAQRAGCVLLASGTSILNDGRPAVTVDPRFATMVDKYGFLSDVPSESNGCHIHLGTLERNEVLELSNRLRGWLPVLQALAANSPFAAGVDQGYASTRYFLQSGWPTFVPPPEFADEAHYERVAEGLVSSGVILDRKMIYWFARPSEHLPTLEVRIADVNADLDLTLLTVVLTRGLAGSLLAEARRGVPHRPVCGDCLHQAHRQAARHGLAGRWSDPATGRSASLGEGLRRLVARARPGLDAAGDTKLAHRLLAQVRRHGTGAERQRADLAAYGSLRRVVDRVAAATVAGRRCGVRRPRATVNGTGAAAPRGGRTTARRTPPPRRR